MYLGGIGVDILIEGQLPNVNVGNAVHLGYGWSLGLRDMWHDRVVRIGLVSHLGLKFGDSFDSFVET